MIGKSFRIKRLFKHSRRTLIVPMDHGISVGPVTGLQDTQATARAVAAGGADALVVHKGLVKQIAEAETGDCELIVHLSASTDLAGDPNRKELVSTLEHAIRLGACAVSVHVNLAAPREAEMLRDLGLLGDQCELWGMPLLAMMYVRDGSKESQYDPVKLAHAARVAEELGADLVKINYTGSPESFREVVGGIRIPAVVAGGPKLESLRDLLVMLNDAVAAGAAGAAIGRNLFQDEKPQALTGALRRLLDADPGALDGEGIDALLAAYREAPGARSLL